MTFVRSYRRSVCRGFARVVYVRPQYAAASVAA